MNVRASKFNTRQMSLFILVCGALTFLTAPGCQAHRNPAQAAAGGSPKYTNKLIGETSPYLLQHAHNPVNWYPWGPEALEKSRRENKPIFLSIGYSACHWCHVMEREDFENEEIAKILNDNFIAIKVDREQRPDIDAQYMLCVQMMTGSGGWPLSVFLTPERKPFFGGTYFPPDDFKQLLNKVADVYKSQPEQVRVQADKVAGLLASASTQGGSGKLPAGAVQQALVTLKHRYDPGQGGFAAKPKFPEAPNLAFLLSVYHKSGDKSALQMVTNTLDHMAAGGIYDQIGGGFHRYSTDGLWRVPHFEKMLYDQALLVPIYLDAYTITRNPRYRQVVEETLEFVARELRNSEGGFTSTLDADSEGEEGKFYLWTPEQIQVAVGSDAPLCSQMFGVTVSGDIDGRSVLHLGASALELAKAHHLSPAVAAGRIKEIRRRLFLARANRLRPRTDDKALASWNGLMIAAYARAFQVLSEDKYRQAAVDAASFLDRKMTVNGQLMHSYRGGKAQVPGLLEDYAFVADGLLSLYDATRDKQWLDRAEALAHRMTDQFEDGAAGGFFSTASAEDLLSRLKDSEDNATPSGNGMAALALARLGGITGNSEWTQQARRTVEAFQPLAAKFPAAFPSLLMAYQSLAGPPAAAQPGVVKMSATPAQQSVRPGATLHVTLHCSIPQGWHINPHTVSEKDLVPTILWLDETADARLVQVVYPGGTSATFAFSPAAIQVYQGETLLEAIVQIPRSARLGRLVLRFKLAYQPCNDHACLAPAQTETDVTVQVN